MRAIHLSDSSITFTELLAGGYDIVVCSYGFFEANGRDMHRYASNILAKVNDQTHSVPQPSRPTSALHSDLLEILNIPFKIAVLDEAQRVNKRGKLRHDALKNHLRAASFLIMSGTLAHNRWHDLSGYLDFGRNHPFMTHNKFLHTFSSIGVDNQIEHPTTKKLRLLQKFLQAITIARPVSMLSLKDCDKKEVDFRLLDHEAMVVAERTLKYIKVKGIASEGGPISSADLSGGVFGLAVIAMMASLHPMLGDLAVSKHRRQKLIRQGIMDISDIDNFDEDRDKWLQKVKDRPDIITESGRVTTITRLYSWVRTKYPDEKIIIFSSSLTFLDIVAEALQRSNSIEPIRFDGLVPISRREVVENEFEMCSPEIPLLMTINTGKDYFISLE